LIRRLPRLLALIALLLLAPAWVFASDEEPDESFDFDDAPLREPLSHPEWFKESFLDLPDDLRQAIDAGKRGIIIYFGQQRCPYCQKLLSVNFGSTDIRSYTQKHFDVIPIDIWGVQELTDMQGDTLTERQYAIRENTNFTPSLIFIDATGAEALRLRGYYPPYKFRAALEYVADGHYKSERFAAYLRRAEGTLTFEPDELNEETFFDKPPYALDRSRFPAERPLAVFFERGDCHACDVLHAQPLQEPEIARLLAQIDSVQLDINADTPVLTPSGERLTARQWAETLELIYTPSILFFDRQGNEIIRADSVIQFYRLRNILNYVVSGGYQSEPSYQLWRSKQEHISGD